MRIVFVSLVLILTGATLGPALADGPAFVGPAAWTANGDASGSDPAHPLLQWHLPGDTSASLTYLKSPASYDDSLALIHTNFSTNKIKPSVDKDIPCQGKTAHEVEFAIGPDGHKIVINRILVPAADGVATITYSRADGTAFDSDVQKSETAFCTAS
jgi:hypothetical protein